MSGLILYVDDERPNRIVFEQSFGQKYRITTVSSGAEALEIFAREPVAVVVTDQRMPGMSGNELLTRVKELSPETIRIIITAYADLDPILRAVNEGLVARYVIKPWERTEVDQILEWSLEAYVVGKNDSAMKLRLIHTERLVTLGSIAGAILHDISEPLSYLHDNTVRLTQLADAIPELKELLAKRAASANSEALVDLVEELPLIIGDMMTGCRLLVDLTQSMRRLFGRTQSGPPEPVDPLPLVKYSMSVCRAPVIANNGRLSYEGPNELPHVKADSGELLQMFINLLTNAVQAIGRREGLGGAVTISARVEPTGLRFSIADDGPGMTPEVLRKVGTPFFSTRDDGTGLGMSQCMRLIGRLGGRLTIDSVQGRGTTTAFTIPLP